jgi:hypothetical protein
MVNTIRHQENTSQNHSEVPLRSIKMAQIRKSVKYCQRCGEIRTLKQLLVGQWCRPFEKQSETV